MTIEHLLSFNLTLFLAILSPGPALLAVLHTTLSSGRRAGITMGLGLGVMASLWTTAALLGLEVIFQMVPWAYAGAKILGALYLLYLAQAIWRSADKPLDAVPSRRQRHAFLGGFLVNLINPKSVLFAAAVLVVIFPDNLTLIEKGLVVANHLLMEWTCYTILAVLFGTSAMSRSYMAAKRLIDRTVAGLLGVLGLRLLFDRS